MEHPNQNRLIAMETQPALVNAGAPRQRLEFGYDAQHRRVSKVVKQWDTAIGAFIPQSRTTFVYDGWNLIAEFETNQQSGIRNLKSSYEWGLDVSGTPDGAGGVGGLLIIRSYTRDTASNSQPLQATQTSAHAPCYDGNGNIAALVNLATGQTEARYDYGPFGERVLAAGGAIAEGNPFRFSTKFEDAETGLLYYGYRFYDPVAGRWVNRDPIGERGGKLTRGYCSNRPVNRIDRLGLIEYNFDQGGCELTVTIKWKLTFGHYNSETGRFKAGDPWTEEEKEQWQGEAESAVEGYYSNIKKCIPDRECCPCRKKLFGGGVKVKLDLQFVESDEDIEVKVSDTPWEGGRSAMNPKTKKGYLDQDDNDPKYTGPGTNQTTTVHEAGHALGLDHPGQDLPTPAPPGEPEDYDADPESLMGRGMELRPKDQNKAFCSKINANGEDGKPCNYSAK